MQSVLVGQISNVHGIKGEVKIYPYTDDIERFSKRKEIFIDEGLTIRYKIKSCRIQKNMLITKLDGIDTIEQALTLKSKSVYIDKSELDELEQDSYYIEDLIGMSVIDITNNNEIGVITYVFNTGANDVYEVNDSQNKKIYLPAIHQVIKKIDIQDKKMYVEIMEGLI